MMVLHGSLLRVTFHYMERERREQGSWQDWMAS